MPATPIDLLRRAETIAAGAPPAEDAAPLVTPAGPDAGGDFGERPGHDEPRPASATCSPGSATPSAGPRASGTKLGRLRRAQGLDGLPRDLRPACGVATSQPTGKLEVVARADDGARSAWAATGAADLADVRLEELEDRLVRRLGWAERKIELEPGRYEVVIPPDAVADLMVLAGAATSGREAEEGRSVFSAPGGGTRVGESLSPASRSRCGATRSRPASSATPFLATTASGQDVSVFDNGLPLERTDWISGGRLARLQYHRAAAQRSGTQAAAPIDNLILELPGATGGARRPRRADRAGAAAHLPLVHPGGGPGRRCC